MPLAHPFGLKIGQKCPGCHQGRLRPVLLWNDKTLGPTAQILERVACTKCSRSFEAIDRGEQIVTLRERGIGDFKNPKEEPAHCPQCQGKLAKDVWNRQNLTALNREEPGVRYLYCPLCNRIAWKVPPLSRAAARELEMAMRKNDAPPSLPIPPLPRGRQVYGGNV